MSLGSFFRRLRGRRRRRPVHSVDELDDLAREAAEPSAPASPSTSSEQDQPAATSMPPGPLSAPAPAPHDLRLIQFAPDAQAAVFPEQRRLLEIAALLASHPDEAERVNGEEVQRLCDRLAEAGELRQAIDLLRQLSARLPQQPKLRMRLCELLYQARDLRPALELLAGLVLEPECRLRAHFLFADHYGREADLENALQHYEAVIALDASTPRARERARELRGRLDRPLATAAPTLLGGEELGPSSRFVLQRELGRGGSGTVYLALDRRLNRPMAVKALHRRVRERPDARTHLFCEARIATSLQDPGIVAIYDLDEQLDLVVMEYCAGGTLAGQLSAGPIGATLALRRLAEVSEVLDRVHRCGVVHRDLKPANLLSRQSRAPGLAPLLITDFGIAQAGQAAEAEPAAAAGTLIYTSPEQRRGDAPEPRSDLYSCGVILLEMILGRPPLQPSQALADAALLDLEEIWRELRDTVPHPLQDGLVKLCRSLVSPVPDHRPADAATLSAAALALCEAQERCELRKPVVEELERRAGPPPHSPEVERWLQQQRALAAGGESA